MNIVLRFSSLYCIIFFDEVYGVGFGRGFRFDVCVVGSGIDLGWRKFYLVIKVYFYYNGGMS